MPDCEGLNNAETLEIPTKCVSCPEQVNLAKVYAKLGHDAFHLQEVGEDLMGEVGVELEQTISEILPGIEEEFIGGARRMVGRTLEDIDNDKDALKEESQAMSRSCDGVLKLRGTRNSVEYTIAVCGSARTYLYGDEPNDTPAHVWIRTSRS